MRLPTSAELIEAWERGAAQQWVDRGLALLAVAYPEKTFIQLQALTIAERDRLLLDLHRGLFGPSVACYAECPECQTQLEFAVNVENLLGGATYSAKSSAYEFVLKGLLVRFCAPDSEDLAALRACADVASASRTLLERCVLEATRGNQPVAVTELPADVVEEICRHWRNQKAMRTSRWSSNAFRAPIAGSWLSISCHFSGRRSALAPNVFWAKFTR